MNFIRKHHFELEFAALVAAGVGFHFFTRVFIIDITWLQAAIWAALAFAVTFTFLLLAVVVFGRWRKDDFEVSPWFAWFIAGGFGAFWPGVVAIGRMYGGLLAVATWGIILFTVWALCRLHRKSKAHPSDEPNATTPRRLS